MLVPFSELPETARVWIYQSSRSFTDQELSEIEEALIAFVAGWQVHGADLHASYDLRYHRFIVLGVDSTYGSPSGCSIDESVHFIQSLEKKYGVDLLDRMNVSYKQGDFIAYKNLTEFKQMAKNRSVSKTTIVFNNLAATKAEYETAWEVPASESWHGNFIK